jgi:AcrR family transcriptional regulator
MGGGTGFRKTVKGNWWDSALLPLKYGADRFNKYKTVRIVYQIGRIPRMTNSELPTPNAAEPTRGRPRNLQTHEAILDAARTLLRREGETRFSIEQVASAAGVSKASIYRRWPTKGALLVDLYMEGFSDGVRQDARSLRSEIRRYLLATVERLKDPLWRRILCSLMAEGQYDPVTSDLLRDRVVGPRRAASLALLTKAVETEQIPDNLDHDLILDLLFGPLWYRLLFAHAPIDDDFVDRLLKQVEPILFPSPSLGSSTTERKLT